MYELTRVRLYGIGPKGARYQDVTLDLRTSHPDLPSPATVLFLENGGGKTVLVRLIFSVILPSRRQIVGTANSRVLEKFVLANDVAHVVLEWRDTRTGQLLITGKASEWRGHVVSADSNRLTERWYTFRPDEALDLDTLPFTEAGRIVSLAGFHERLDEAEKDNPALQVRWVDKRGEWTEHLGNLWLDPELFSYQRKMNAGEGEAADAFTFKSDEAFVDWLLTAIVHDEEPRSFGEVVTSYASQLASRGELMAERDFVQGAIGYLKPLADAEAERAAADDLRREAMTDAKRLVNALEAREKADLARHEILAGRVSDMEAQERGKETEVRRLNSIVNELKRLVAELRWKEALDELNRLRAERGNAGRLVAAWQATRLLVEYRVAHQSAETIREILHREETEAEPLLNARDAAAARFARGLLAVADTAEKASRDAEVRGDKLNEVIGQVKADQEGAIRESAEANAVIERATGEITDIQNAIEAAVASGLLADGDDTDAVAVAAEKAAGESEERITTVLVRSDDLAAEREQVEEDLGTARGELDSASRAAEKLGERLGDAEQRVGQLRGESRLTELLGADDIVLDTDVPDLVSLLGDAIVQAGKERDALQVAAAEDQRILEALGSGGLLPPSEDITDVLNVLASDNIVGWSGWEYLSKIRADERDEVLARYPSLVDGVVLNSGDDLSRASEKLAEAHLLPRTVIALGMSAAMMDAHADGPAGIGFVVPPNPAMYDTERADQEREQAQERQRSRGIRLRQLERAIENDKRLRAELEAWRRNFPPGALVELRNQHERAETDERNARERAIELEKKVKDLAAQEKELRRSVPGLRISAAAARSKADDLRDLAKENSKIPGLQEVIRRAGESKKRADEEASRRKSQVKNLEREQRKDYREADNQRRTASSRREELAHVIGGGSVGRDAPVPDEPLESLRSGYRTAEDAYAKAEVSERLRAEVRRKEAAESQARAAIEDLDIEVHERASALLLTPEGSDSSARAEATVSAQRQEAALQDQVNDAAREEGRLQEAFNAYEAQQRSLEPYGRPFDIPHGEELIRRAQTDWDEARRGFEKFQEEKKELVGQTATIRRSAEEFGSVRESLLAIVAPEPDEGVVVFAGSVDAARLRRDKVRESLSAASRLLDDATNAVRRMADLLAHHTTDERFEKVGTPVRRQMTSIDRDRLPEYAAEWHEALKPRLRVLTDELEQIERHRAAIIERLQGMVKHALGRLKAAQKASRLPPDLGDWSGLEFLRISFTSPDDEVLAERLGGVIDEVAAATIGKDKGSGKRDGLSILLSGVRSSFRPKGVRVEILKPDSVLRDERVRVAEIGDVFSGGQLLTTAIILYCTMAWLRAGERGQVQRPHAGVLFLDNPIGRASAGYLLELQMNVAKKLGVQLVYTTGLFDVNALSVFPLIIRLRNDADLRAGMKYLRVNEEIRARLPEPGTDETGVLSASRLFSRSGGRAS